MKFGWLKIVGVLVLDIMLDFGDWSKEFLVEDVGYLLHYS